MASSKTATKTKKTAQAAAPEDVAEEADGLDAHPTKIKNVVDPVELDPAIGVEEKLEEDPIITPPIDDEDAVGDEASLDTEDLNPFGDRWEE